MISTAVVGIVAAVLRFARRSTVAAWLAVAGLVLLAAVIAAALALRPVPRSAGGYPARAVDASGVPADR